MATWVPSAQAIIAHWDWLATPTSNDIRSKVNYTPPEGQAASGAFSTNEQSNGTVLRFGTSSTVALSIAGGSDVNWAGFEFTSEASNYTISGSRVSYLHGTADGNYYVQVAAGSQSATNVRLRGTGGGIILNNSPAAVGLNLANGSNGLMADPQNTTTCNAVFDGTGTTSLNYFSIRNTNRSLNVRKQGTGTLVITGSTATAPTSTGVGYMTGSFTILGGTVRAAVLADGDQGSSLGGSSASASNLIIDGGILEYSGAANTSTNREMNIGTNGATISAIGTGGVTWSATNAVSFNGQSGARTITFAGNGSGANRFNLAIPDEGSNPTSITKTGGGSWTLGGQLTYTGPTTVSGGTLTFATPLRPVTSSLVVTGAGSKVVFDASGSLNEAIVVAELGAVTVLDGGVAAIPLTNRPLVKQRVVVLEGLEVSGGLFDVGNNDMVVRNTDAATLVPLAESWWADGARNGSGIGTTAGGLGTVAVVPNATDTGVLFSVFAGVNVSASDALVKFTYLGDTNLDGSVTGADLSNTLRGIRLGLSGWVNGDNNYDGIVDGDDLANLLTAMRLQGAPLGNVLGSSGVSGGAGGAVPEPAVIGLGAVLVPLMVRRRR